MNDCITGDIYRFFPHTIAIERIGFGSANER